MSTQTKFTAFFYQDPVVLNRELHKGLRHQATDVRFASHCPSVPLMAAEFTHACLDYPIVFTRGLDHQWMAVALTSLQPQANAFVDAKGRWNARYVPASVRRYPFILAKGEGEELVLAADLSAPQLGETGEALFTEQGEPTDLTRSVMQLLAEFQTQIQQTQSLVHKLEQAQLLNQENLQVHLAGGQQAVVEGVWIVDENRLRALPDATALAWFKSGELQTIHAHLTSLRTLPSLLEKSLQAQAAKPKRAPRKAVKTAMSPAVKASTDIDILSDAPGVTESQAKASRRVRKSRP
jgi:hypothetical protein